MWGWFSPLIFISRFVCVFPTGVGVIPKETSPDQLDERVPHGSGGDSHYGCQEQVEQMYFPWMWGWFLLSGFDKVKVEIFLTGVGVILEEYQTRKQANKYSSQEWGWFLVKRRYLDVLFVFFTVVRVFLFSLKVLPDMFSILHQREGHSHFFVWLSDNSWYSTYCVGLFFKFR